MPAAARSRISTTDTGGGGAVVHPFWPLLATMLGGVWLGWSWFLFNGARLTTERLRRQIVTIGVGLAVSSVLAIAIMMMLGAGILDLDDVKYVGIALAGWKLTIAYVLYNWQSRDYELWEYYGGAVKNGIAVVVLGLFARPFIFGALPFGWWTLVLQ